MMVGKKKPRPASLRATVPVIAPVLTLIVKPGGRSSAAYFSVPLLESAALIVSATVSPSLLVWSSGTVMVTRPLIVLIDSPAGSPNATKRSVPLPESAALMDTETEPPSALVWSPGLTIVTVPAAFTVQLKLRLALLLAESVAVTVTEYGLEETA